MAVLSNNKEVIFYCLCCHKEIIRPATTLEILQGRYILPKGWESWRVLTRSVEFCDSTNCQLALDNSTVGYPIDNASRNLDRSPN